MPKRFEDEYPKAAEFLQSVYAEPPRYTCARGHRHWLKYFLHCGFNYCQHIPLCGLSV